MGGQALKSTWGFGKSATGQAAKAVLHPASTLRGAGSAMKTAAVGGAAAYVGWETLTTDKSVARVVGDAVIGEQTIDDVGETINDVKELKNKAGEAVESVNETLSDVNSSWGGMTKFFRGLFNGDGVDMVGNFFKNMSNGNVSGLSIAGLVAAAFMVFGRFGWLAKIAGAMLGFMMLGNNSSVNLENKPTENRQQETANTQGMRR